MGAFEFSFFDQNYQKQKMSAIDPGQTSETAIGMMTI